MKHFPLQGPLEALELIREVESTEPAVILYLLGSVLNNVNTMKLEERVLEVFTMVRNEYLHSADTLASTIERVTTWPVHKKRAKFNSALYVHSNSYSSI